MGHKKEGCTVDRGDCAAKEGVRGGSGDTLHPRSGSRKGRESAQREPGTQEGDQFEDRVEERTSVSLTVLVRRVPSVYWRVP
eukprot:SAG11_NODE_21673_length_420_cov_2.137072_1_plen_81_part_10